MVPCFFQSLYADITKITWPKDCECKKLQLQKDGSVCVTSNDEFASLVLSPHSRDFTVCYLSALSVEPKKKDGKVKSKLKSNSADVKRQSKQPVAQTEKTTASSGIGLYTNYDTGQQTQGNHSSNPAHQQARTKTPINFEHTFPDGGGLNLSPIANASCVDNAETMSNTSGSPVIAEHRGWDSQAKFRPSSTPTEGLDRPGINLICPICQKPQNSAKTISRVKVTDNVEGSFLGECFAAGRHSESSRYQGEIGRELADASTEICLCTISELCQINLENQTGSRSVVTKPILNPKDCDKGKAYHGSKDINSGGFDPGPGRSNSGGQAYGPNDSSLEVSGGEIRRSYTWLTRHISCDECTTTWSHAVKLAHLFPKEKEEKNLEGDYGATL